MRKIALATAAVATSTLLLAACGTATSTPATSTTASASASVMAVHKTGAFSGLNGKAVTGTVSVSGTQIVLSGFTSDQGPDLHVYLTNGTDEAAVGAGKQISSVAYNQASQTFNLNGVDPEMYTTVVIHCDKAKAVFGAAHVS